MDPNHVDPYGLVEIKNPYSVCDKILIEAAQSKDFYLSLNDRGQLHLKKSHKYYFQVLAAMFCTERKWCDFVVRTTIDIHVERIEWDSELWAPKAPTFLFHSSATGTVTTATTEYRHHS